MDAEHVERLVSVEERAKSNSHRIDEMEKRQDKLDDIVSGIKALSVREERVEKDVAEIKKDVKDINAKPSKRKDVWVAAIISALVGILLAYIAKQIGLGG